MGKIVSFILALFFFLQNGLPFVLGRDGRAFGRETIVLEADSFPVGTEQIEGFRYNGTFRSLPQGLGYVLEKRDGNKWLRVEPKDDYFLPIGMYLLKPFQKANVTCDLTIYDPLLEAGRYRIVVGRARAEFMLTGELPPPVTYEVTLTTEFATYPVGTEEITATLYNGSLKRFDYTVGYAIEKWDGEEWVYAGPNLGFITLMVYLFPGGSDIFAVDFTHCDPPLEAGRYRVAVRDVYGEFSLE